VPDALPEALRSVAGAGAQGTRPMLFELRLKAYRLAKPFMKPVSRLVSIPRPVLLVGPGSTRRLCELVAGAGARRTLIVTDSALARLGIADTALEALRGAAVEPAVFDGIVPDPTDDVLVRGLEAVRQHGADSILAIGGGSSIDGAKIIAAMATNDRTPAQLVGIFKVRKPPLPLYAAPTTAGTGSEVTVAAVATDPVKHEKRIVLDPKLVPVAAVLDPLLMMGMPPSITAATGMDALTHAVEAYVNRWPHADTRMLCVSAVKLIFGALPRACADGSDLEARESMALASLYAGLAFTRAYVGYVHAFSHKVGGVYGVPHGLANAIFLPHVLEFLRDAPLAEQRLAELGVAIGSGTAGQPAAELALGFVEAVRALERTTGIPPAVAELRPEDIPAIARAAMIEAHRDYPVPKNMRLREAEALLTRCLN
jgi:alcohol dehydrogenase